jgi:hypothetical protein
MTMLPVGPNYGDYVVLALMLLFGIWCIVAKPWKWK